MHFLKWLSREKTTQDQKVHFIKGNELSLTQVNLHSFIIFKNIQYIANEYFFLKKIKVQHMEFNFTWLKNFLVLDFLLINFKFLFLDKMIVFS